MRWTLALAACASLVLGGCGASPASSDTRAFVAGLSAFQAGDQAALDAALTTLKVDSADAAPCSAEAFAAARRDVMRRLLEPMTRASPASLSEEARFLVLATALDRDLKDQASPAEACKGHENAGLLTTQDAMERGVILQAVLGRTRTWHGQLADRHGEHLDDALRVAAGSLKSRGF